MPLVYIQNWACKCQLNLLPNPCQSSIYLHVCLRVSAFEVLYYHSHASSYLVSAKTILVALKGSSTNLKNYIQSPIHMLLNLWCSGTVLGYCAYRFRFGLREGIGFTSEWLDIVIYCTVEVILIDPSLKTTIGLKMKISSFYKGSTGYTISVL